MRGDMKTFNIVGLLALLLVVAGCAMGPTTSVHSQKTGSTPQPAQTDNGKEIDLNLVDPYKARDLSDSITKAAIEGRYKDIYLNMEKVLRDSAPEEQNISLLKQICTGFGELLEIEFKGHQTGYREYSDGSKKPMRKYWYAIRTSEAEKGTYFMFTQIVPDGDSLACSNFSIVTFFTGIPAFLDETMDSQGKIKVDLFVMSKCPFAAQVLQEMKKVLDKMGDYIEFKQYLISTVNPDGTFKSLHGESETEGNIVELCAEKYYHEKYKYMDLITCMASDIKSIPGNWKTCAAKNGIDAATILPCIEGKEGKQLLLESAKKSESQGVSGSPTLYIAGEKWDGERTAAMYQTAFCCAFSPWDLPPVCAKMGKVECPQRVAFNITVLTDKRCKKCGKRADLFVKNLKDRFPKAIVDFIDYADPGGKELYEKLNITFLPAFIFSKDIKKDAGHALLNKWLQPAGDSFILQVGSNFNPTKEICDNGMDDTGNGKKDCHDEDCKASLVCRKEKPATFDLFVMSHCKFGPKALGPVRLLIDHFKDKLTFTLHFLVDVWTKKKWEELPDGPKTRCTKMEDGLYYCSLKGKAELEEDLRQACVKKYYPKDHKYLDYILCRTEDLENPDWETCAKKVKMKPKKIEKCSTGKEGLKLLQAEAKLADDLGFSGSPTFFINNVKKVPIKNRTFEGLKEAICKENENLKGCE